MTTKEYNDSVEEYADNVYRFILSNLKEEELSRDIVQDAYERLWINHEKVDAKKVRSYLFTTAHNRMIDMIRKNKHSQQMDEVPEIASSYHDEQYSDINEVLKAALSELNETQRSVLLLRDYESYSYKEIAEITRLTESQVKVYIYRARSTMKEKIGSIEAVI
ncbi:MAG: RNA polymerase sigma factor [Candidatus Delongbacteria bacterium]|jgi:RNA polymerase sigma factor (sigma-70 family)|nr:RNA polymerase sigma factor [Candidatus Delongbacteria bacterium]